MLCQHDKREGAKFCDECGVRLCTACHACGIENRSGAKFCHACGTSLTAAARASGWRLSAQPGADAAHRLYALLPEIIARLQSQKRVTYRMLTYLFGIDAALLHDIREELTLRRLASDEAGKVLVWIGEEPSPGLPTTASLGSPTSALDATVRHPVSSELHAARMATEPFAPSSEAPSAPITPQANRPAPDAERRQLTVMFCDLADSTTLSQQLDPEDLREVVRAYQSTAAEVIQQYDGHMAQYLGDGLLMYFGWPVAHEDDAQRAAHAGLGIVEAMTTHLNPRLEREKGVQLTVRLGVHTGPVVVGEMGGGGRHENLATGETVNIAARLEGLAVPNTVVISQVTERLLRGTFAVADLGPQVLKGVAEPLGVFQVLGPIEAREEEAQVTTGVPFLVGRAEEIGLLRRRWEQSKEGLGQVVLVSGEAGIGKSSLVHTLRAQVRAEGLPRIALHCSAYHRHSALYPVTTHLERLLRFDRDDAPTTKLDKLEQGLRTSRLPLHEVVPLFAELLSVPLHGRYAALTLTPPQQKQQTLDALVALLFEEAELRPVLVTWEDLHWADPSTLEMLGLILEQTPTVPMLHVLTFRPEFAGPWPTRSHMTPITLNRLERPQVEALITHLAAGKGVPTAVVEHLVAKTDGVPLYVEELTKMLLESALLRSEADRYVLTGSLGSVTIPDTLQDALMARLDPLKTAKEVAQLGAVLGREFAYDVIQGLWSQDEATLQDGLSKLVEAELLYQRGRPPRARYLFKHALIQDAAYASLLRSTRQQVHAQAAQLLEGRFPETVAMQPELVAHHYTEAGAREPAVDYWQRAGRQAAQRSAYLEAIQHFRKGVEVLLTLPHTPERDQHELTLRISLGASLSMTRGIAAPEVEEIYLRARALCQQVGDTVQLSRVLFALWSLYGTRAAHASAQDVGEQLLALAQQVHTPTAFLVAYHALGNTLWWGGAFASARHHLEQALRFDTSEARTDGTAGDAVFARVETRCYAAFSLWMLGYPEQARQRIDDATGLAENLARPFTMCCARHHAVLISAWCGQAQAALAQAEAELALATEHGFSLWRAGGHMSLGIALTELGQPHEGVLQLQEGIAAWHATGCYIGLPLYLGWLADVSLHTGQTAEAQAALTEALALVHTTGERCYEAELHRLQGELLLRLSPDNSTEAAACLQQALDVARQQQAKGLELRAAMSLARLWQAQGKGEEARDLLAPVYGWFTEGFAMADLMESQALLNALEGGAS